MRKKVYGSYRVQRCPACDCQAVVKNAQGLPVCEGHRTTTLSNAQCACGEQLELREGKFGAYFHCMRCGAMSIRRATKMTMQKGKEKPLQENAPKQKAPEGRPLTPEEVDIYYS